MADRKSRALWAPKAVNDVGRLWEYLDDVAGQTVADNMLRDMALTAATLGDFPFAGRSRNELRLGLRSIAIGPHILFYRVIDGQPEIVRVLDGRRDLESIFSDDE
ncbi:MAG: type II toxin-antitoxin system RelE/ParE family toxin [Bradyrhizobium sp.]